MSDAPPAAPRNGPPSSAPNSGPGAPGAPGASSASPAGGPPAAAPQGGSAARRFRILGAVVLLGLIGGGVHWFLNRNFESTDNAVIDGDVVQISPRIGGAVLALAVSDNQLVRKGDMLLTIDARDYETAAASARAALANAEAQAAKSRVNQNFGLTTTTANLDQAQAGVESARASVSQSQSQMIAATAEAERSRADLARYERLATVDFASKQRFEQAQADSRSASARLQAAQQGVKAAEGLLNQMLGKVDEAKTVPEQAAIRAAELQAAEAQVAAARAAVAQAELNLSYTRISAPADGIVTRRRVNVGDQVEKGGNLIALVVGPPWITANFKETQITRMRVGQPVEIAIDAYPDRRLKGRVDSIQRGTGARFALLPPENATGNYVKVVQRVPVKIVFDPPPPPDLILPLGVSVTPTVDVAAPARP